MIAWRIASEGQSLVNALRPKLLDLSYEKKELVLSYNLQPWMQNHYGILHGGMTCSIFDTSMGILSQGISGTRKLVTSNLQVNFLKAVEMDKPVLVRAKLEHLGKITLSLYSRMWQDDENKCNATAMGSFFILQK